MRRRGLFGMSREGEPRRFAQSVYRVLVSHEFGECLMAVLSMTDSSAVTGVGACCSARLIKMRWRW